MVATGKTSNKELEKTAKLQKQLGEEEDDDNGFGRGLAIRPFTVADIVENFLKY